MKHLGGWQDHQGQSARTITFMSYPGVVGALLVYDTATLVTHKNAEHRVKGVVGQCRQQLPSCLWVTRVTCTTRA